MKKNLLQYLQKKEFIDLIYTFISLKYIVFKIIVHFVIFNNVNQIYKLYTFSFINHKFKILLFKF